MSLPTPTPELSALLQGLDQNQDLFVLIIDRHYRIIYANSAVQMGFDLDLAKLRGQSLLEVLYDNQKFVTPGVYISPIIEAVDTGKGRECFDFHMKLARENELQNWYNAGISVTHDAETGQVKYATGIYYRIQREKTLERELNGISWKIVHSFVRTLDKRDLSTGLHSQRVAELMVGFAQFLGMSKNKANFANLAGVSHDIGKIVVPEQILAKPGKLNDAEYEKIKQHPVVGAEMIADIKELQGLVPVIRYHHERYDGQGYPEGLKGKEIPYFSRMLSLCDSFDAMTGERCYRKPISSHEALTDIVRMSGKQFDPDLAKFFCCFIGEPLLFAEF